MMFLRLIWVLIPLGVLATVVYPVWDELTHFPHDEDEDEAEEEES